MRDVLGENQDKCFAQLMQLFMVGDQAHKMHDYLRESGVSDFELPGIKSLVMTRHHMTSLSASRSALTFFLEYTEHDQLLTPEMLSGKGGWMPASHTSLSQPFGFVSTKVKKGSRRPPNKWTKVISILFSSIGEGS